MSFTEEQKLAAWNKATAVPDFDPRTFRKDACGAWIIWDKYGVDDNLYGWEIDHVVPRTLLESKGFSEDEINAVDNLRALQHMNNVAKGMDYPSYTALVTSDGDRNVDVVKNLVVNSSLRNKLDEMYGL